MLGALAVCLWLRVFPLLYSPVFRPHITRFVFAALSLLCSTLHIVLFDYDVMCATHPKFSGTVSLNAAIFSSVLLASRLPAALHVFAFVCFAFEIFAGLPIVLALVRRASSPLHFAATAALCVLAARALAALRFRGRRVHPCTLIIRFHQVKKRIRVFFILFFHENAI